jgi:endonuclease YncB( thermonuclease family)
MNLRRPFFPCAVRVLACALLVVAAGASTAQSLKSFTGRVVSVLDGDSLVILDGRQQVEARLHGVDAPEGGQAYGNICRRTLSNLVFGKTVSAQVVELDRYQRSVSRVSVDGLDVGLAMIRAGCAWHYRQYSPDAGYAAAEQDARRARRGLWQDAKPVAPWEYRQSRATRPPRTTGRGLLTTPGRPSGNAVSGPFHGNVTSKVYHAPGCEHYHCKNCTAVFATREAAVAAGYRAHAECVGR